jgi:tetratricopeptide (TPR) repeat protein
MADEANQSGAPTAESIFLAALERPSAERADYVAGACGENQRLRQRVEALLRAHEAPDGFLPEQGGARPVPPPTLAGFLTAQLTEQPGATIGRYKLREKLGEGGCGVVYLAEQEVPIRRKVALKIIKLGMDTRQVVARFEAERQALALMDHPNIARVIDAGATDTGRPYFVMELVGGVKITEYCKQNNLNTHHRLELFIQVCRAIQHAHQKGVIHRDIKPSNVLVAMHDGVPVPKVIDFGIAKATHGRLTDETVFTAFEQFLGTPAYMSPEQAQLGSLDVDTRSDIYCLGVLLYELLTGTTPFDTKELVAAGLDAMRRTILEKEPSTPSTRLRQERLASQVSDSGKSEIRNLKSEIDKDLDWIVMKCLEKDRARRYETVNGLAADIQRHLSHEPVVAGPPTAAYRFSKLVRRHRGPVMAAVVVTLFLVGGIIGTTWGLLRALRAQQSEAKHRKLADENKAIAEANERSANAQRQVAVSVRNFLQQDLLRQANPWVQASTIRARGGGQEIQENPTIKELLERASLELAPEKIEAKFPGQPEVQASIIVTMGDAFSGIGEYGRAEEFMSRASDLYQDLFGADHTNSLKVLYGLARVHERAGNNTQAIELFQRVRDVQARVLGADHPETLLTIVGLATAYRNGGKTTQAIDLYELARNLQEKRLGPDDAATLATGSELGWAYREAGRFIEAAEVFERIRDAQIRKFGVHAPETLETSSRLGEAYIYTRKLPQAIELLEQVKSIQSQLLGADHPATLKTLDNLGFAYREARKLPQAIELLEQVRLARLKRLGADHPDTLSTTENLANAYMLAGNLPKTIEILKQVLDAQIKKLGPDHPAILSSLNALASAYQSAGNLTQAIALFERLRDETPKNSGADHPNTIVAFYNLGVAYRDAGRPEDALPLLRQAVERVEKRGFRDPFAKLVVGSLVRLLEHLKRKEEAMAWYLRWPDVVKVRDGPESPPYVKELSDLGLKLMEWQKWKDAEQELGKCLALQQRLWPQEWSTFNTRLLLGRAFLAQTNYSEAEPLLLAAYEGLSQREASIPPKEKVNLMLALDQLVELYEARGQKAEAAKWSREAERRRSFRKQDEGAIRQWLILAPISVVSNMYGLAGFSQEQLPEEGKLRPAADDKVSVGGKEMVWKPHLFQDYAINFNALLRKETLWSVAYAVTYIWVPEVRTGLHLHIGSDDEARVYLNGRLLYHHDSPRPLAVDEDTVTDVELQAGVNVVVFKVMNQEQGWQGSLRFANADDTVIKGLKVTLDPNRRDNP